ncbi:putative mad3/BUB1 hoMad3/BUB1 homology region 1 [Lyophyllum shimeji]|uniref:Mad3/BUB1 hoMad3/BUB1 homology region 1 n=1 Tax=Lyophyllum shimeji TaxID=47721 RepID=A0A9P3UP96_LYOSH|nr:putative mad3/BUB1 hoMad3/BUB1 homology region 1 [Lyophyllum shimeji]
MPTRSTNDAKSLDLERQQFRARLATAISEEDDPLAVFDQFVQWTIRNYGENDPASGLVELLQQATAEFKNDPIYRTDLRYLKLWTLYASQVPRPEAINIYANLLAKEIGTSFAILYEGYATVLEVDGRWKDADVIYRHGIKRMARPLERLKKRYKDFQSRGQTAQKLSTSQHTAGSNPAGGRNSQNEPSSSSSSRVQFNNLASFSSTPASRYAYMLAPPDPSKRPEKLRFDLSLLYTREGGEFCIQEARARSMGLLGKKWGPPPPPSITMPVNFNDDGTRSGMSGRRKSTVGGGEPTVTINTREALEDVFGMYNSPDKTMTPWKANPSMRRVEPMIQSVTPRPPMAQSNENAIPSSSSFRPFVDENARPGRTPSTKFTPFKDENKLPATTPRPALSVKESAPPPQEDEENTPRSKPSTIKPLAEASNSENVFSRVFTPAEKAPPLAPLRDVFTEAHGKPQPKNRPAHERAKSHHDVPSPAPSSEPVRTFTPFVDENAKTPFKVFSRPPEQSENAYTPKTPSAAFTPFTDPKPAFTPFRDAPPTSTAAASADKLPDQAPESSKKPSVLQPKAAVEVEDSIDDLREQDQYEDEEDESFADEAEYEHYEAPLTAPQQHEYVEEGESYQEIPLGGRFGKFNVMTPITERTFEYTTSTRGEGTPSDRFRHDAENGATPVFTAQLRDEHGAAIAAEKLAAELRKDDDDEEEAEGDERLEPLRLSTHLPPKASPPVTVIEEKTGSLSLGDTLTLGAKFKPPNPCNPFDRPIMATLLSRIPSDPHFYDLRDRDSGKLDGLQKFAKKARKTSGGSSTGASDIGACFSLELDGHRFSVSEKLGEGGFGAVFKARDLGTRAAHDDSDDDLLEDEDVDEESSSMVALKVVNPRNLWEYHVLRRLQSALPAPLRRSVVLPHALYAFRDESFLVLDFCPQGTLLSIVNNAVAAGVSQQGGCLDELLVVFFTVELLRLLEAAHKIGFIHGDLKIDNCLLRLEDVPGGASAWSSVYQPSGEGGWKYKGLKVIDFGRTIDTRLFPPGQHYIAEWPTDDRDCFEARENKPWTFQTDYFGLVGIIYCMLFGKYMQGSSVMLSDDRYKISTPFKRYWQTDLWTRLFDVLLNPCLVRPDGQLPVSEELGALRGEMEAWLQANCNRTSNTLKGLLKKVEVSCYVR